MWPPASSTTSPRASHVFKKSDQSKRSAEELVSYYQLAAEVSIVSIEDGCAENDWDGWKKLTDAMGANTQLVVRRSLCDERGVLRKGIERGVGNSILVKVNQIGTLTEPSSRSSWRRSNATPR
jgi:enolase